jgi:hypothetical protein
MATRATSVGGIGHTDARDAAREQNGHEKVPHASSIVIASNLGRALQPVIGKGHKKWP